MDVQAFILEVNEQLVNNIIMDYWCGRNLLTRLYWNVETWLVKVPSDEIHATIRKYDDVIFQETPDTNADYVCELFVMNLKL